MLRAEIETFGKQRLFFSAGINSMNEATLKRQMFWNILNTNESLWPRCLYKSASVTTCIRTAETQCNGNSFPTTKITERKVH